MKEFPSLNSLQNVKIYTLDEQDIQIFETFRLEEFQNKNGNYTSVVQKLSKLQIFYTEQTLENIPSLNSFQNIENYTLNKSFENFQDFDSHRLKIFHELIKNKRFEYRGFDEIQSSSIASFFVDKLIKEDTSNLPTKAINSTQTHLLIIEDNKGRREYTLDAPLYSIGRDPKCDIQLISQFVSRRHATLFQLANYDGSFYYRIVDGNVKGRLSANGLLVNGRKLLSHDLKNEDEVVFGPKVRAIYHLLKRDAVVTVPHEEFDITLISPNMVGDPENDGNVLSQWISWSYDNNQI